MKNDYYALKILLPGVLGALFVSLFIFLGRNYNTGVAIENKIKVKEDYEVVFAKDNVRGQHIVKIYKKIGTPITGWIKDNQSKKIISITFLNSSNSFIIVYED